MTKDFSQVMSERTDKQLVEIVTLKRNEYQPEAVIAAEKELSNRQIDPLNFYTDKEKAAMTKTGVVYKENIPLEKIQIAFTILLPALFITAWALLFKVLSDLAFLSNFGFIAIVVLYYFIHKWLKDNGYERKAKEFMKWTTYTVFIYVGLMLIIGLSIYFFR